MTEQENPKYSQDDLKNLKEDIISNKASLTDYLKFDKYLSSTNLSHIIRTKMQQNNIADYNDYLSKREKGDIKAAAITGTLTGIIEALQMLHSK